MPFWWNTSALPIIAFMRFTNYPEDAIQLYILFFQAEILSILGPSQPPIYPSWMTDDHTPLEFSLVLGKSGDTLIRFAIEPSALPLAGDRSIGTLRNLLQRLSSSLIMKPDFSLDWFDICAQELLLADTLHPRKDTGQPLPEPFIGTVLNFVLGLRYLIIV
jgi:hypothetical protein